MERQHPLDSKNVLVLHQETPAQVAARAMLERSVGSVVIANAQGQMVGLITDRDLACEILAFGLSPDTPIGELMGEELQAVTEGQDLSAAVQAMKTFGIRRLPILRKTKSGKDHCVGMVTLDDLAAAQAISIADVASVVKMQMRPRKTRRKHQRTQHNQERAENTYYRFLATIAANTCLMPMENESLAFYLLRRIVQRLPAKEAVQFISQLPKILQEDLLNLPSGPDRNITAETILAGLPLDDIDEEEGEGLELVQRCWQGVSEFLSGSGEIKHVLTILPRNIRALLLGERDDGKAAKGKPVEMRAGG